MEECVDDTLEKSMERKIDLIDLSPILERMEKFKLRLNPKKYASSIFSHNMQVIKWYPHLE